MASRGLHRWWVAHFCVGCHAGGASLRSRARSSGEASPSSATRPIHAISSSRSSAGASAPHAAPARTSPTRRGHASPSARNCHPWWRGETRSKMAKIGPLVSRECGGQPHAFGRRQMSLRWPAAAAVPRRPTEPSLMSLRWPAMAAATFDGRGRTAPISSSFTYSQTNRSVAVGDTRSADAAAALGESASVAAARTCAGRVAGSEASSASSGASSPPPPCTR